MVTLSNRSAWARGGVLTTVTSATSARSATSATVGSTIVGNGSLALVSLVTTLALGAAAGIWLVVAIACFAAAADVRTGRIPNRIVSSAAVATVATMVAMATAESPTAAIAGSVLGVVAFAGPLLVVHLVSPCSIGFGDVKLAGVAGAALGLVDARLGLVALCIASGVTALVGLVRRRQQLPLGPGLVLGSASALLAHGWWS